MHGFNCPKCKGMLYVIKTSSQGAVPNWLHCQKCDMMYKVNITLVETISQKHEDVK